RAWSATSRRARRCKQRSTHCVSGAARTRRMDAVSTATRSGVRAHELALLPEPGDAERDDVTRLQEPRRLLSHAAPGWRAGGDPIARQQRHELAEVADQMRNAEDHRARIAALHPLPVDVEPHIECLRIGHFVARDEVRADRTEGVAALAAVPLAAALKLEVALGNIVDHAVASNVGKRTILLDVLRLGPDHHAEVDFPVRVCL